MAGCSPPGCISTPSSLRMYAAPLASDGAVTTRWSMAAWITSNLLARVLRKSLSAREVQHELLQPGKTRRLLPGACQPVIDGLAVARRLRLVELPGGGIP